MTLHTPVMLEEVLSLLDPKSGKSYLDATLGYAGHTLALLEAGASVTGIDQDASMLKLAGDRVAEAGFAKQITLIHDSFSHALSELASQKTTFDGIIFDLGVSSYQLDTPERGFSFRYDAPLDMRMDVDRQSVTAADLVNGLGVRELEELFTILGEERAAKKLAQGICEIRKLSPIKTTSTLAGVIESIIPRAGHLHPATKVFQALRMAVNSEREQLKAALPSALSCLLPGGVLVVISFHSLEDKIVKDFITDSGAEILTKKPLVPSETEISSNPRARSAKLRALRKVVA